MTPDPRLQTPDSLARLSGWTTRRGQLRGAALLVLTAAIFALLFRQIDVTTVLTVLGTLSARAWLVAFLLTLTFPVLSALRWRLTLRAIGHQVPFRRCLTIILGVSPVSAIAPSKAGDLLKAISFRGEIGILEVSGTVLVERALDVIVLAALATGGALLVGQALIAKLAALIAGAGVVTLLLVPVLAPSVRRPALRDKLHRALAVVTGLRARPATAVGVVAYTVANWLASVAQTAVLLEAVGARTPFALTLAVLPIAIFIGLIPVTLGGMGTRDAALVGLLAPTASAPQALAVGLLYSFFGYWLLALLGLPFVRTALFPRPAARRQAENIHFT